MSNPSERYWAMKNAETLDAMADDSAELEMLRDLVRDFFAAEDRVSLEWGYENYQRARTKLRNFMTFGDGE